MRSSQRSLLAVGLVLLLAALYALERFGGSRASAPEVASPGEEAVLEAFRAKRSKVLVEVEGEVVLLMRDDRRGRKHQHFLVRLPSGHTLKIAHNIDLAERVPVRKGDRVRLKGQYEWNVKGGVLHWTHHDPAGRHPGGWIEHQGRRYE